MIRILNAEPDGYCDAARRILNDIGRVDEEMLSRQALMDALPDYDVLIVRLANQIDREVIDRGARLKAIVTATTGLDHIDVDYATERGIAVLGLRGETDFLRTVSATAEHTWGLLLSLVRWLPAAVIHARDGGWDRDRFRGHELAGKRLGILGLGRIGSKVARYGLAFNMQVSAYDPYAQDWVDNVRRADTLEIFLKTTDVLSIHTPLNNETESMIGPAEFALFPLGAWLVNTARGEIVNEDALVDALERGHLHGAALDVINHERSIGHRKGGRLLEYARSHDNLLITPHIAGAAYEAMAKTEVFMARKLRTYLDTIIQ